MYVLLMNTSKFWFNYRQTTNTLYFYRLLRDRGIPDENILLFSGDNIACNSRNNDPGTVTCYDGQRETNIYNSLELDYKNDEVSTKNWLDVLRKRYHPSLPFRKRLLSDSNSALFVFMSGHGGDYYHKIQDKGIMSYDEFARAIRELYAKQGYHDMLIISDSCGSFTIFDAIDEPNIIMLGASLKGELSHSFGHCAIIEQPKFDRFSKQTVEYLMTHDNVNFETLMRIYDPNFLNGNAGMRHTYPAPDALRTHRIGQFIKANFEEEYSKESFESEAQHSNEEKKTLEKLANLLLE